MVRNFFKIAFRNIWKNKLHSIINITGLASALTCAVLVSLFVKYEFSYDAFHKNATNIYRITTSFTSEDGNSEQVGTTGQIQGPAFKASIPEIKNYLRMFRTSFILKTDEKAIGMDGLFADSSFFELFSFRLHEGNPATVFDDPVSVVITEAAAVKLFGHNEVIGEQVSITHGSFSKTFQISAVTKKIPSNSSIRFDILVPFGFLEESWKDTDWLNQYLSTFVLLQPGVDPKDVERKFQSVFSEQAKEQVLEVQKTKGYTPKREYGLQKITDIHLNRTGLQNEDTGRNVSGIDAGGLTYSYILIGIVAFILLMACINFVNLSIGLSFSRSKEIGIRKITGSSKTAILSQFLLETTILCIVAFLLSILLSNIFLPGFNSFLSKELSIWQLMDLDLIFIWMGVFVVSILLAGLYPAIILSNFNAVEVLYNKLKISSGSWFGKSLVVLQFSLAIGLIIATIVYLSQMHYISEKNLGYKGKDIIRVFIPLDKPDNTIEVIKEDFLRHASIADVATASDNTVAVLGGFPTDINLRKIKYVETHADEDFLPMLGIQLLSGRNFNAAYPSDVSQSAIVNEAFVKAAGLTDPIGESFINTWGAGEKRTIIGVVKDYHYSSLKDPVYPQVILLTTRLPYFWIKIHPGRNAESIAAIRSVFAKYAPSYPFEFRFLEDETHAQYKPDAQWKIIIQNAAMLSIVICCIGLFGLAHLASVQRTKEIGVRKILGASVFNIISMLASQIVWLVIIASFIAFPIAWFVMQKWLQGFAYRIDIEWWMLVTGGLAAIVIAMLTVSSHALRVAIANPVDSLRTE